MSRSPAAPSTLDAGGGVALRAARDGQLERSEALGEDDLGAGRAVGLLDGGPQRAGALRRRAHAVPDGAVRRVGRIVDREHRRGVRRRECHQRCEDGGDARVGDDPLRGRHVCSLSRRELPGRRVTRWARRTRWTVTLRAPRRQTPQGMVAPTLGARHILTMLIATMNDLPGDDIEEVLGEVFGLTSSSPAPPTPAARSPSTAPRTCAGRSSRPP